jgi:hypothetical protein
MMAPKWLNELLKELAAAVQGSTYEATIPGRRARLINREGMLEDVVVHVSVVGRNVPGGISMLTYSTYLEDVYFRVKALQLNPAKSSRPKASKLDTMFYITIAREGEPKLWDNRRAMLMHGEDGVRIFDN